MQKFSASHYGAIASVLTRIRMILEKNPDRETAPNPEGLQLLVPVKKHCEEIGLRISLKCLKRLEEVVDKGTTTGKFAELISQLERTVQWEMEDRLFMFVPPDRAEFYDKPELLGKTVNARFPRTQFDALEAGNCYATGRSTAAVFHLMRIMEVGVQEFGKKLGIELTDEKVWQVILDQVNKAIRELDQKNPDTVEMSQAAANLYAVKLAWRNEVMHPKETYTNEEAENLIRLVRLFMEKLATIA